VLLAGVVCVPLCLLQAALAPLERAFTVQRWTTDDGLPGNSVKDLEYGPDNLLWGVSDSEVWRFDGAHFFTTPAALEAFPAKGKGIKSFEITRDGRLFIRMYAEGLWLRAGVWGQDAPASKLSSGEGVMTFMTPAGVWTLRLDGLLLMKGSEPLFFRGAEAMLKQQGILTWAAPEANGSNVWITASTGLYRFSEGAFTKVEVAAAAVEANFERVCVGASGQVWLYGHPDRFYVLRDGVWETLPKPVGEWPVRMGVEVMVERNGNELWVGTADGLFQWDGDAWGRLEPGGLAPSGVLALQVGQAGELWAGLEGGGLLCLRERRITMVRAPDGPAVQTFSAVYERRDGVLYAGIANAGLWSGPLDCLERMDIPKLYKEATVLALAEDSQERLLIGPTGGSLLRYSKGRTDLIYPNQKNSPWMDFGVRSLLVEPTGRVWAGTQRGLMFERAHDNELNWASGSEQYAVNFLARTADGKVWAASDRKGVIAVEPDGLQPFKISAERGVPFPDVRALHVDSRGRLWAGGPRGLAWRGDDGVWHSFASQRLGTVVQILEDGSGLLWVGTLHGIASIATSGPSPKVVWYGREDGLDSEFCSGGFGNAGCRLRDGRLLFPTQDGLAVVEPQRLSTSSGSVEPLLDEVSAEGRALWQKNPFDGPQSGAPDVLTVPAGTRVVTIRYLASNPAEGGRVLFRHRLGDEAAAWSPWTRSREALFEKLQPADYPFSLQVMMRDGQVAELLQAPVLRLLPLWWQRRSLQVAGAALLLLVLGAGIWRLSRQRMRRRLAQVERERSLEAERLRIARDIHDRVGAKLTKIGLQNEMVSRETGLPLACQALVKEVAETTRETILSMDEIVWAINPKNDTLENSINYLIQYTREFLRPAQVSYKLDLPMDLPRLSLTGEVRHNLFMAFKEALNNAVKHGHPRHVRLALGLATDRLALTVEDDGCGFTPGPRQAESDGLENMHQRMSSIGGNCRVESAPGKGTSVILEIPLR
jgi:signal transduction histidine kinase/ligand-binding sensor domain-containing protein